MEQYMRELEADDDPDRLEAAIRMRSKELDRAIDELEILAKKDSKIALVVLGDLYLHGWYGTKIDKERGETLLVRAAEMGSIEGGFRLASHYQRIGKPEQALQLHHSLAGANFAPAQCRLGVIYGNGTIVPKDSETSRIFLEQAIRQGHIIALKKLALFNLKSGNALHMITGVWLFLRSIIPHFRQLRTSRKSDRLRW